MLLETHGVLTELRNLYVPSDRRQWDDMNLSLAQFTVLRVVALSTSSRSCAAAALSCLPPSLRRLTLNANTYVSDARCGRPS